MNSRKIQFQVKSDRVIELFARDIYQSPLTLLRENVQNAFDAILMRKRDGDDFCPRIDIRLSPESITVTDNGNGMTAEELEKNYWYMGNSGKNTETARKAGVVGTFGIGAMANFGTAQRLEVETESSATGERSRSTVAKEDLSINQECIDLVPLASRGEPGTTVTASLPPDGQMNADEARRYISDFVALLEVPVYVDGVKESGRSAKEIVPLPSGTTLGRSFETAGRLGADVDFAAAQSGAVWVHLDSITWSGRGDAGSDDLAKRHIGTAHIPKRIWPGSSRRKFRVSVRRRGRPHGVGPDGRARSADVDEYATGPVDSFGRG